MHCKGHFCRLFLVHLIKQCHRSLLSNNYSLLYPLLIYFPPDKPKVPFKKSFKISALGVAPNRKRRTTGNGGRWGWHKAEVVPRLNRIKHPVVYLALYCHCSQPLECAVSTCSGYQKKNHFLKVSDNRKVLIPRHSWSDNRAHYALSTHKEGVLSGMGRRGVGAFAKLTD